MPDLTTLELPPLLRRPQGRARRLARGFLALVLGAALGAPAADAYNAELVWDRNPDAARYDIYVRFIEGVGGPPAQTARQLSLQADAAPLGGDGRVHFAVTDLPVGPTVIFAVTARRDGKESPRSNELLLTYEMVARYIDSDGDGLLDYEEDVDLDLIVDEDETDSRKADTDGDGLSDSDELFRTFTDPREADSDGDGTDDARDTCNDIDRDGFGTAVASTASCKRDNCPLAYNPAQRDSDSDSFGDECDACNNLGGLQNFGERGTVVSFRRVYADTIRGNDGFKFRGEFGLPPNAPFAALDPSTDGMRILVEAADGRTISDITIPPGLKTAGVGRGWKTDPRGNKFRYADKSGERINGVVKILLKDMGKRAPGQVRAIIKARDGDYPVSPELAPLRVVVVLGDSVASEEGACGETVYNESSCRAPNKRMVVCN